ncbi:precorrin-4 C(11)-methyltransferase [bacterium BMS3Abin14]|nr:precorrin-4 C(11)-methyltransferase [bacterium BMS3Abin14]
MENMVCFIGAGPGHSKYLTLEGAEALRHCRLVFALPPYPETFREHLAGKRIEDPFRLVFSEIKQEVETALGHGSVGFLVPGDLTLFSPFFSLVEYFGDRARVIAGVGVINAATALLKRTLDLPRVSHSVVFTSPKRIGKENAGAMLGTLSSSTDTMILYMNNRPLSQLMEELAPGFGPDTPVAIVFRVGLAGEKVYRGTAATIADVVGDDDVFGLESGKPSMGIILIGDVLEAHSDPSFWDRRKDLFWDRQRRKV